MNLLRIFSATRRALQGGDGMGRTRRDKVTEGSRVMPL